MSDMDIVIAVASGKGGTGKTTVSTNLARVLAQQSSVCYIDCDVEEPNGHLFLQPEIAETFTVTTPVPVIDEGVCQHSGECAAACEYNALAVFPTFTLVFPELCHGCGGCLLACPSGAISEIQRPIGIVEKGKSGSVGFVHGKLNVGDVLAPTVIRSVLAQRPEHGISIIDAPPGTSCAVVASVRKADILMLVTEPTAFGLHDLTLAVDLARELSLDFGVVINRSDMGDNRVEDYCAGEGIPVWARIPDDRRVAEAYSRGEMAVDALPEMAGMFEELGRVLTGVAAC